MSMHTTSSASAASTTTRRRVFGWALGGGTLLALAAVSSLVWAQQQDTAPPAAASAPAATAPAAATAPTATATPPTAQAAAPATPSADPLVERGRYLARLGDCVSCHTGPSGIPFAGGLSMKTPFGTIVSTNITPDRDAGIGAYTEAEFARALREGQARDGHHLYPAMPYTSFARTTDEDVHALYTYFQKDVQPSPNRPPPTRLPWPFGMRWLMVFWNWLNLDGKPYQPDSTHSSEWNRGAYLVTGLGHCGECHTPRGRLGSLAAQTESGGAQFLAGASVDGWLAQPLRHGSAPSAAQWSTQDIADYLRTGRTTHTAAFGPMVQVVQNSTQHLTAPDLSAIAAYLQSIGAPQGYAPPPDSPQAKVVAAAPEQPAAKQLRDGQVDKLPGAMVYLNNCDACHRSSGAGWDKTFPALAGNTVVNAPEPDSLIRIVLSGSTRPVTDASPAPLTMPGLGWRLTDEEVAQALTFVRNSWGNHASAVTPAQVQAARKGLPSGQGQ